MRLRWDWEPQTKQHERLSEKSQSRPHLPTPKVSLQGPRGCSCKLPIPQGGHILTVAWKTECDGYVYKIGALQYFGRADASYSRDVNLICSTYTTGDVVTVNAFAQISGRTIEKVNVSGGGVFTYDIKGGFEIRAEDITGIAARR